MEAHNVFKKLRVLSDDEFGDEVHSYCALLSEPLKNNFVYCEEGGDCRKCVIPLYIVNNNS